MLKFSIKNAFRKKATAILSSIGVGIGLMLVFVIGAFTAGVTAQFQQNLTETIGLVEVVEKGNPGAYSHLPLNITDLLLDTPEVGEFIVAYNVETQAPEAYTLNYNDRLNTFGDFLTLIGTKYTLDQAWGGPTTKIITGRNVNIGANETIIDSRLIDAAQFPVGIGDNITIDLGFKNASLTIVGIYTQEDSGAPDFVPREYYIYTDIDTIWNFLSISGDETNIYTTVSLRFNVETIEATQVFVDKINDYSQEGGYFPTEVSAYSLSSFYESIQETFAIFDAFAGIIGFITVLAGGTAIVVTQLMSVTSRLKEFAILKSTGWKNRHIFTNVIYESLTLGILGAFIGLGLGTILVFFLSSGDSPFGIASAIITIDGILEVVAYALGLGILGGLYPGIKAARVRPIVVLKGE
jgi:putative ABC transport system permease protein